MKKKVLFTASIAKHILRFHLPYLNWFQEKGYEVHIACLGDEEVPFVDKKWTVPFVRSPFSTGHFEAYNILKEIINREAYCLIHCHTPMASVVTKLASIGARKKGSKVLYTAHGFHFYKGASFLNWLTYYPVEILTSGLADAIITINNEDYDLIVKCGNKKTQYFLIPGIGVAKNKYFPISYNEKLKLRNEKGFKEEDFIAVYAAEFIPRKNHQFLINSLLQHKQEFPNLKLLFCGRGEIKIKMEAFVHKNDLDSVIFFMGFRTDIDEIFKMADIGISSSKQEGLGLNLIEEMMCGLPIIATEDRGHREIIDSGENGFLFPQNDEKQFIGAIKSLYENAHLRKSMGRNAIDKSKTFELSNSLHEMGHIYSQFL